MTDWATIQRHLGLAADGIPGPATAAAVAKALGISAPALRRISAAGKASIKAHEGLMLKAYPDPGTGGDPWTIGYGHTAGVRRGDVITEAQADAFLSADLERFEAAVRRLAPNTTQGQFDALVSFAFNVGEAALAKSTLLQKHLAGDYAAAANEFGRWVNAGGRPMAGLVKRRAAEKKVYLA